MQNSSLEITDREYLIKLPKEEFNLSFIHQLLKRIQAEQFFFSARTPDNVEDIINETENVRDSVRFDNLDDK